MTGTGMPSQAFGQDIARHGGAVSSSFSSSPNPIVFKSRDIFREDTQHVRIYMYRTPPPPFSSSILHSYFATRNQHILPYLKGQKVSFFFFFDLSPTIRIFFFLWFLSLVSGLVRMISGLRLADVKKLPT